MKKDGVIKNRYEFMVLVQAKMCNPNGDPDRDNSARQDAATQLGIITDVSVKRWIRNYIGDAYCGVATMEIMMQNGTSINRRIAEAVMDANGFANGEIPKDALGKDKKFVNKKVKESGEQMALRFWDVRAFGGVLSTGLNAGQLRGAVQIAMANSVDPIEPETITITRMAYADGKDFQTLKEYEQEEAERPDDKKRTMGNKSFIPYGLYIVTGTVSAAFAERTGFTEEDLNILWEAILQMLDYNVSSSKTGMSIVSPVIIFKHVGTQHDNNETQKEKEARLGCAPAHKLFGLLDVHKKDGVEAPRSLNDYEITFNYSKLPKGVELGLKSYPYEEPVWGREAFEEWDEASVV